MDSDEAINDEWCNSGLSGIGGRQGLPKKGAGLWPAATSTASAPPRQRRQRRRHDRRTGDDDATTTVSLSTVNVTTVGMTTPAGAPSSKFRINHLDMGTTGETGIRRLLDLGQGDNSYFAIIIALALAQALQCGVTNLRHPVLTWFEQMAVLVLLTLLSLCIRNIRVGPRDPAFLRSGADLPHFYWRRRPPRHRQY
ncbi:hypothetical protein As57867_022226, partial [Aphanomyces stellatus]